MTINEFIDRAKMVGCCVRVSSENYAFLYASNKDLALDNWFLVLNLKDDSLQVGAKWNNIDNDFIRPDNIFPNEVTGGHLSSFDDVSMFYIMGLIHDLRNTPTHERGLKEDKYYLTATRYYIGPVPETHYIEGFESCANYTKIKYGSDPKQFTESELENITRNEPALTEFIDAHKELVHEKKED